jgi:hypothetical protein
MKRRRLDAHGAPSQIFGVTNASLSFRSAGCLRISKHRRRFGIYGDLGQGLGSND